MLPLTQQITCWLKKPGQKGAPANLLKLGVRANTVSVRLAGLKNEYWPLNHNFYTLSPVSRRFPQVASQFLPTLKYYPSKLNAA